MVRLSAKVKLVKQYINMANIPEFKYAPMFQLGEDKTEYRLLTKEGVTTGEFEKSDLCLVSHGPVLFS